ncbi:usg protein [Acidisoma sp. 7E03]
MSLSLALRDWRLTTAEILYHLPDHPTVLQTYIWQEMDLAPDYPSLRRFLDFWKREIEGPLHSVRVAQAGTLITPPRFQHVDHSLSLH